MVWDYAIDGPQHRIIFLDSRTCRELPQRDNLRKLSCGLLDDAATQAQLASQKPPDGQLAIVVAATPYVSLPGIDNAVAGLAFHYSPEYLDNETWVGNAAAYRRVGDVFLDFKRVLVLSGDVHYGFGATLDMVDGERSGRLVQFCCSSLRKQDEHTPLPGKVKAWLAPSEIKTQHAVADLDHAAVRSWIDKWRQSRQDTPEGEAGQARIDVTEWVVEMEVLDLLMRAKKNPAFEQRFLDADVPFMRDLQDYLRELLSTRRHRIQTLYDSRDAALRGTSADSDDEDKYTRAAVGYCNVGVVTFEGSGADPRSARQTLYWETSKSRDALDRAPALATTMCEASLVPLPPAEVQ